MVSFTQGMILQKEIHKKDTTVPNQSREKSVKPVISSVKQEKYVFHKGGASIL
jgi:hypothetical protein